MNNGRYSLQITGRQPVTVSNIKFKASARNAAIQGLALRAEDGAKAIITDTLSEWREVHTYRG